MKKNIPSFRSPLNRVRSLGPAHHGTGHWWMQRLTALALIPLTLYVLNGFFTYVVFGNYESAVYWLRSPFSSTFVILLIAVGFHHAASGLQVVIEDYIHCECAKLASIIAVKFLAVAFALLGILAAIKILFGV
jgi:succinate dehydrogenase / fumarate reductase membrane anchor subunit